MGLYPKPVLEYLALAGIPRAWGSRVFVVDAANGSDGNAGDRWHLPLKTVSAALAKCESGRHDTVLLLASASGANELAAINWNKNLTHLVGLGAETHVAQRSRLTCGANGLSPFLTVSGYGCIFRNLYVWQGRDHAGTLLNVSVTGQRNLFKNVHFAGGGHATQAINGGASLYIAGGSENLFEDCTVGIDTIPAGDGMAGLVFAATGGAARNVFRRCHFSLYAGNAGAIFVELLGNWGIDRYQLFENCLFSNLAPTAMTSAFVVAAGFDPASKRVLLKDCALVGAGEWESANRGALYLNMFTGSGGTNSGFMLVSAT